MKHIQTYISSHRLKSSIHSFFAALPKYLASLKYRIFFLSLIIGVATGVLRTWFGYQLRPFIHNGAGDFSFATRIARDLWNLRDPYAYPVAPDSVSYPLPAGILAMPFALFEDEVASGLFIGASSFILALCLLRNEKTWPLLLFLSWPFTYAVLFSQWSPLIMTIWFLPFMMPLILVKPHIAIPLVLTSKISKPGLWLTALLLIVSLILVPTWPFSWREQINTYRGIPPIISLPLGPLLLVALLKYRDRRAWLLVLFAFMPQRVLYDQLPLFLLAATGPQMAFLLFCSWLTLPALFVYGGWSQMPLNWQFWIILTLYIPGLIVVLWPELVTWVHKRNLVRRSTFQGKTDQSK